MPWGVLASIKINPYYLTCFCGFGQEASRGKSHTSLVSPEDDILVAMQFDVLGIVMLLVVILLSMTLHEAMHAFASNWLGDDTARAEGRLTLNPVAHIDPFLTIGLPLMLGLTALLTGTAVPIFGGAKPVPFNPNRVRWGDFGAALVGVAGPLTNLVIAFVVYGLYIALGQPSSGVGQLLQIGVIVNLGFFVFNMIPIPPLDGSRVLYAIAPDSARRVMELIERNGLIVVFAIVLLFGSFIGAFVQGVQGSILDVFDQIFSIFR
jgi:Zn-dependent protease